MKNKILELALLQPNGYPWEKAKLDIDRKILFENLKDFKLEDKVQRRKINKLIRVTVLEKSKGLYEAEEVKKEVIKKYQGIIDLNEEIVGKFQGGLNLDNNNGLKAYNDFLNNDNYLKAFEENIEKNFLWLVDSIAFKYCAENEMILDELINKIKEITQSVNSVMNYEKYLKLALTKRGYINDGALKNLKYDIRECTREIREIFNTVNTNKKSNVNKKIEFDINDNNDEFNIDSIVDIFLNEPTALDFTEEEQKEVVTKEVLKKEEQKEELEKKQEVNKNEIDKEEITISKTKYEKLVSNDKEREIKIIKELAHLKNGAVLSELYNCYKNIDNISKENLEITLSNFFNALNMYEIEVIEEGRKVGQDIQVDTKEVLKEFIFTSPVEVDGIVNGKVEYLGWSHNGKQIVPMVVRPNK